MTPSSQFRLCTHFIILHFLYPVIHIELGGVIRSRTDTQTLCYPFAWMPKAKLHETHEFVFSAVSYSCHSHGYTVTKCYDRWGLDTCSVHLYWSSRCTSILVSPWTCPVKNNKIHWWVQNCHIFHNTGSKCFWYTLLMWGGLTLMKILYLGKFALRMSFVYKTFCQDSATSKRMWLGHVFDDSLFVYRYIQCHSLGLITL